MGIKFERHPEIAINAEEWKSGKFRTWYTKDYDGILRGVAQGVLNERDVLRSLFANDLWFLLRFGFGIEKANHPFVVEVARMVEAGPRTDTLDIWARFHFKSSLITQAETLQFEIKNQEKCTGIHCYVRPAAKAFLRSIKILCEESELLQWCFPDVLWKNPKGEAPKWSEDEGLILKRNNSARKESSIEAWGLVEGMATGRHFERNVFDDLETDDIRESPDMLDKVFSKFNMAFVNLGTGREDDQTRVIGTYYSHFGPNIKIRDMKYPDGRKVYQLRLIPGSKDGTKDGEPVLMDQNTWEKAKMGIHFNSQQLCDPTPSSEIKLDKRMLRPIEPVFIPKNIYKFMVLDQAGGDETDKQSKDLWSYGVFGVEPSINDIGQSKVYLLDVEADKMSHSQGIDGVVRMYCNHIIRQLGVEKVGLSTTEIHIANALRAQGRRIELKENLIALTPSGRSKNKRVEDALQWPLNNGMLYYSTDVPSRYIDAIKEEMDKFPFYHVDILDMWAYLYDLIKEFKFRDIKDIEDPLVEELKRKLEKEYSPFEGLGVV